MRVRRLSKRPLLLLFGVALVVVPSLPPLSTAAADSLTLHMLQHVLIGDIAPLALLLALPGPVLPRLHPAVGVLLWALSRAVWHYPALFDAAVANPAVHVLEHLCLLLGGIALWAPVLGRMRAGVGQRIALDAAFQVGGTLLGLTFLFAASPLYPHYVAHHSFGSPLADQRAAGALMMGVNTVMAFSLAAWLILGLLRDDRR